MMNFKDHADRASHQTAVASYSEVTNASSSKKEMLENTLKVVYAEITSKYDDLFTRFKAKVQCKSCLTFFNMIPERGSILHNLEQHKQNSKKCSGQITQPTHTKFFSASAEKSKGKERTVNDNQWSYAGDSRIRYLSSPKKTKTVDTFDLTKVYGKRNPALYCYDAFSPDGPCISSTHCKRITQQSSCNCGRCRPDLPTWMGAIA